MENAATRFGQRLAHTEKKYRDQALKKLTVYLTKKSEWSALEWDKLWKALFYCMWMSDKRPIQEELSTSLSQLVHKLPTPALALGFVHSFFRTMHREWHGIDGLRLDKFYSLVRKFVHESIALLRNNDWEHEDVEFFVSILSSEVVSQLPNGLRMHLSDLFLEETWKAAGASVESDTFLLLLEPFFTLLSSEYDKAVFKRVRELVFLPMLSEYKFGPQPEKEKTTKKNATDESGETDGDEEEEEEEDKVFEKVELAYVQHRLFAIASADDTAERNRSGLYSLYSKFYAITKVDSLKAVQEGTSKPKTSAKKKKKDASKSEEPVAPETPVPASSDATASEKKSKKNKKRKKNQVDAEDAAAAAEETTPVAEVVVKEAEPEKSKKKKQKTATKTQAQEEETKTEASAVGETSTKKSKKSKKEQKNAVQAEEEATKTEAPAIVEIPEKKSKKSKKTEAQTSKATEETKTSKEETKVSKKTETETAKTKKELKKQSKKEEEAKKVEEPAKVKKTKEAKDIAAPAKDEIAKLEEKKAGKTKAPAQPEKPKKQIIIKSGMKFQRCSICKGFGKGFLPAGKDMCGHCERKQKVQKKAAAAVAKKRKASEIAASSAAAEADAVSAKKVTFGKNKALPHELSVKRLKASAKKDPVPKEESSIKGVLKATSTPLSMKTAKKDSSKKSAGKGRMKAADYF